MWPQTAPRCEVINLNRVCPLRHLFNDSRRLRSGIDASERIPRRPIGEFEVAEIGAEPQTYPRTDRDDGDVVGDQRSHAKAADEIGGTIDAAEALENRVGTRQVVDQHHRARSVSAGIEADARPLPEHTQIAGVLGVERAVAITQAADKSTAGFFAQNVAVWLSPAADCLFNDHGQTAGDAAKESMAGSDQFVRREPACRLRRRGRSYRGGRRLRRDALCGSNSN